MNRRRFLAASATVTVIGFAGCGEPDDEGDDDDGGGYTITGPRHEDAPVYSSATQ